MREELRQQASVEIDARNLAHSMQQQACAVIHEHMKTCQQDNHDLQTQLNAALAEKKRLELKQFSSSDPPSTSSLATLPVRPPPGLDAQCIALQRDVDDLRAENLRLQSVREDLRMQVEAELRTQANVERLEKKVTEEIDRVGRRDADTQD